VAIGINWANIWNEAIWASPPIWAQTASQPAPDPEPQKGAGRSKRRKHRYFVEIDGEEFDVSGPEEAAELLGKAKALAAQVVEQQRNAVTIEPGIKLPQIRTPNKELVPVVREARQEIRDLYAEFKRDLEIRRLMAKAEEEEEEAIIRLLM
jgi:hypothetical protein